MQISAILPSELDNFILVANGAYVRLFRTVVCAFAIVIPGFGHFFSPLDVGSDRLSSRLHWRQERGTCAAQFDGDNVEIAPSVR